MFWQTGGTVPGTEPTAIGARYTTTSLPIMKFFLSSAPVFFSDAGKDERVDSVSMELIQKLNIHAIAVLPLFHGEQQIGVLILESEEPHDFTQDETRLFSATGPANRHRVGKPPPIRTGAKTG